MQTLLGKNNLQTIAYTLYNYNPKQYQTTNMYQDLSKSDQKSVDRIIFNLIRQDFY